MSEPSDAVPVERLVEHRDFVRALARTLVRDGSRADDLEQEVWLTTLAHPPRHADGLRGWFRRITRSRAIDMARGDVRRERLLAGATSPATPTPAELAARLDAGRRVASAVARLDEPYRAAVLLRFYEGVEPAEIAARTGVPLETVRTRLRRAIDRMRADLDRDAGGRDAWVAALLPIAAWPTGDALTGATGAWAAEAAAGGVAMGTKATVVAAVAGAVIGTVITAQLAGVAAPPVAAPDDVAAATEVSDLRRRVEAVESRAGQAAASATRAVESRMRSQDERIASLEATLRSVESGATGTMPARTNATEQADPAAQRAEGDAAGAKRRTADEVADDLLLKLRRTVADTSQSEATRLEALTALRRMPSGFDRGVVLALTDLFRTSTFADTRDRILRDLHNAKAPDAAADLRQLYLEGLRDADEEVRERAAEDIDTFVSEPEVRQALESVAASDPSKGVRKRAALTLEKVK